MEANRLPHTNGGATARSRAPALSRQREPGVASPSHYHPNNRLATRKVFPARWRTHPGQTYPASQLNRVHRTTLLPYSPLPHSPTPFLPSPHPNPFPLPYHNTSTHYKILSHGFRGRGLLACSCYPE